MVIHSPKTLSLLIWNSPLSYFDTSFNGKVYLTQFPVISDSFMVLWNIFLNILTVLFLVIKLQMKSTYKKNK